MDYNTFVVYITTLNIKSDADDEVYPLKNTQIAYLKPDKAFIELSSKYADFANVFLSKLTMKLRKYIDINNHTIKFVDNQQPLYGLIYNLDLVKLETLKAYIENNLTNSFIKSPKSLVRTPILCNQKLNKSLKLCVKYQGLNNLIIKNRYLLSLVGKSLDQLGRVWRFTQFNLTNIYH